MTHVSEYIDRYRELSDEEFILGLYQDILRRQGDAAGVAHHLDRLNGGATREEIVNVFLNSEEFRKHSDTSAQDGIIHSESLTPDERERLYCKTLRQDFYGNEYADDGWRNSDTTHIAKAEYITKYFPARKVIDVGCSFGRLVQELRNRGIDAYGIDYSDYFVNRADQSVREYLKVLKVEEIPQHIERQFELVVCMEVLEHLPLSVIEATIEALKKICSGSILLTIPSHGPNQHGRYGFPMHHVEDWMRCARENRTFTVLPIVKATGLPHCGHITLASYQWWTDKFLQHDLIRDYAVEQAIVYDEATKVYEMGWSVYVLREATEAKIAVGEPSDYQLGRGFVCQETFLGRKVAWTGSTAELFLKPGEKSEGCLSLCLAGGPEELVFPRVYSVAIYQLNDDIDRIQRIPLREVEGEVLPGMVQETTIDLSGCAFKTNKLLCCEILVRNTWTRERIFNSFVWGNTERDTQERGVGFLEAALH